jgi:hypothetical protein
MLQRLGASYLARIRVSLALSTRKCASSTDLMREVAECFLQTKVREVLKLEEALLDWEIYFP